MKMIISNGQVYRTLEHVRLRQIPWHKREQIFQQLQEKGLLACVSQTIVSMPERAGINIATLTELGRAELSRLMDCPPDEIWSIGEDLP